MFNKIPSEWHDGPRYFFTYYGEVYIGSIFLIPNYDKGFFIISNNELKKYQALNEKDKNNPNELRKIGWEIKDVNIITKSIKASKSPNVGGKVKVYSKSKEANKYKRMIIFGAGASSFCTFDKGKERLEKDDFRPPLGNELFDERFDKYCKQYPGVDLSLAAYEAAGNDIEAFIEDDWKQIRERRRDELLKQHLNVQHYMHHLMYDISNHIVANYNRYSLFSLLSRKLNNYYSIRPTEKIAFVSFNYDTILDNYLEQMFSHSFSTMEDYVDYEQNFVLYKPHGSANWGWKYNANYRHLTQQKPFGKYIYDMNSSLDNLFFEALGTVNINLAEDSWGPEKAISSNGLGKLTINKDRIQMIKNEEKDFYPALLIPHKDKDEFLMPYFHQNSLSYISPDIEELFLIGWKGAEDVFNRFMNKHLNKLKRIVIVSPNEEETGAITKTLKEYHQYAKAEIEIVKDFETFVVDKFDKYFI